MLYLIVAFEESNQSRSPKSEVLGKTLGYGICYHRMAGKQEKILS
jgi:hypothetical protein